MTTTSANKVMILQEDYNILTAYIKGTRPPGNVHEKQPGRSLSEEMENAIILSKHEFPGDVIRLNSTAIIKDLATNRVMTITIVLPSEADIKKNKISVLAPLGTALLGYRKNQQIQWQLPAGTKNFLVMEVYHSSSVEGNGQ